MKQKLTNPRYMIVTAVLVAALAFGATQAPADAECLGCTQPPPTECDEEEYPHEFCHDLCVNYECPTGRCDGPSDICVCAYKNK